MTFEAMAQLHLLNLSGCAVAESFDENDIVGHPPFGDPVFKMRRDRLLRHAGGSHNDKQRPFLPCRMRNTDHRRFDHARASHRQVFDIDRTDPFTA